MLARAGQRIGLPTIPLFMLAGILFGPHTPGLALFDDPADLKLLSALGLVFLLFYLGLEFHLDDLVSGGGRLLTAGGLYLLLNVGGGLAFGFALGWGGREAFVLAGVIGISSSAIVTKILMDMGRLGNPESRLILGIIVVEDVFLALYLALLQPILSGADSFTAAAVDFGKALAFLLILASAARWGGRWIGRLVDLKDDELLVVTFVGLAVLVAGVAEEFGVSDAIGAFMVGLVLGATPSAKRIQTLVHPLRDAFAAIFFFAFGLQIDPGDLPSVAVPVAIAVAITLVLNLGAGLLAGRLHGFGREPSANVALTVLSRGEFALVLATMAAAAGLDPRLAPFIAGYVLILAVAGPLLSLRSERLGRMLPERWFPPLAEKEPAGTGGERAGP
ncbi:cation:proton antiporter [Actinomadura viridis]|uniref:CPA2 family monovalent cation:H+ antiporter-2 n=1 Tax=Actinomadura viridis TaxID=58110 RepID=A0A931GI16_9ACTN|nr:cation:proton antiporter [Actinomadura viridis]MBG6088053.1 CPA2 family monovalent cation:H+ antiporter-2 [Actinomadura viridis]